MGGSSAEREISLLSGNGVLEALQSQGVDAQAFDPAERDLAELKRDGFARCFIALHGRHGEDGTVQGALELLGIPYTGSGVMASAIAMDKVMTKRVWIAEGLPTPRYVTLPRDAAGPRARARGARRARPAADRQAAARGLVDRRHQGDVGYSQMQDAVALAAKYDAEVLCEEFIEGDEVTCPVLGQRRRRGRAAGGAHRRPRGRLRLPEQVLHRRRELPRAERPAGGGRGAIQAIVLQAYRTLGCRGWGRADLMVRATDRKPFLLEMNTSPGMTGHSLVPMSARAAGISYEQLCLRLLRRRRRSTH